MYFTITVHLSLDQAHFMCHEISHMGQYRSGGPGRVGLIQLFNEKSLTGPRYRMAVAPASCPCSTYCPKVETECCFPECTPLLLNRFLSLKNVMAPKAWIPWTVHSGAWHEPMWLDQSVYSRAATQRRRSQTDVGKTSTVALHQHKQCGAVSHPTSSPTSA